MMHNAEPYLVAAAVLILAGVLANKVAGRLGVPAVLLFLLLGMLAGSDGLGGIEFADYTVAQAIGVTALAFILFDGGLSTRWDRVRPALHGGLALATVGVVVTAAVTGVVATWALDVPLEIGLLLGAIVSSTDAAAVFSVLRSRGATLRPRVQTTLELESGTNDPMAVFLTIALIEVVVADASGVRLLGLFVQQMVVGAVLGLIAARLAKELINRSNLDYEGLYPVVSLSVAALTYGGASLLGGSGFLAVYLAGIVLGNDELLHRATMRRFHDAIAWLCQIGMFLVLGLLVFPSELPAVAGRALIVSAALILVARPLAVAISVPFTPLTWRERGMVGWVGLRGAVPIILATFPFVEGVPEADLLFNVVFFVVITSVLVQGTTIPFVARLLRVEERIRPKPVYSLEPGSSLPDGTTLHELEIPAGSRADGRRIVDLALPPTALIVLITRGEHFVVPRGATELQSGDSLLLLADDPTLRAARDLVAPPGPGDGVSPSRAPRR